MRSAHGRGVVPRPFLQDGKASKAMTNDRRTEQNTGRCDELSGARTALSARCCGGCTFARTWLSALLSLCLLALGAQGAILINEVHYDPDVKTEPVEFIELFNSGSNTVDLSGWRLADAVTYTFPGGTQLSPSGYLVVAQNPPALQTKFGVNAIGPWAGALENDGEKITLLDAAGNLADKVEYQLGFPWPTVGDSPGYSIELANPAFDNDLGGNWRASVAGNPALQNFTLISDHSSWKYFKGLSEASTPTTAWRALNFPDASWSSGAGPIGYGESSSFLGTNLSDMRSNYTTVFFRKTFVVTNAAQITGLTLEAVYDDGFKVWINGSNVLNPNISSGELPYTGTAGPSREDLTYNTFNLNWPQTYLVTGTNIMAIQAANSSLTSSSDFFLDVRLLASSGPSGRGPTPGAINSVYAANLPPAIRQVDHDPKQPLADQPVTITAKVTDPEGVASVSLLYQLVDPGDFIELTDAVYENNWTSLAMNDSGANGDALAGDSIYTVVLPGSLMTHRRLVRYRISASDGTSLGVLVPYPDDPQPNFAFFCYNGVPSWQGAVRPGSTPVLNCDTNVMRRLPVVHLIAKSNSVVNATWFSRYGGDAYLWSGALVYDGKVYDHVHYRARGGVWRYAMVKNMWKFDFNRGHDLQMRDDYGEKFKSKWTKLNLGASIQQGDYLHRGEQGMFESVGYRLFSLAGVESPTTAFLQFRVIDSSLESNPTTQYEGDFWGVYLAIEQEDRRFLDEHDLPDGNFYKMEGGTGELNNLGPLGPTDKSDLNYFLGSYRSTASPPAETWWRTNLNLMNYWSYQAIVQGIHHYDICYDKNYFYYRNPDSGIWSVHSWDLDLTWANNMYDSGCGGRDDLFLPVFGDGGTYPSKPAMTIEYKNRVREVRDLLFNNDQAWAVIDEYAGLLRGPTTAPTILDADRCMWDYNPKMTNAAYSSSLGKAGHGRFYQWPNEPTVTKDFNGCIQLMKNYVVNRSAVLNNIASDVIPALPTLSYIGGAGYPINRLSFRSSAYNGTQPFAAMKWRIGEVTDTNAPAFDPTEPRAYEIKASWDSAELTTFNSDITIPSSAVKIGHAYRVRVKMQDATGRWSNWSAPAQFITTEPDNATALVDSLRVSEVMFNPPAGNDFEFVELHNISTNLPLDLDGVNFTSGIDLTFPAGTILLPDSYLLVVRTTNVSAFRAHYGLATNVPLAGPYTGSLANDGEKLELKTGAGGTPIFSFDYSDGRGWPVPADGAGHSLVPLDRASDGQASGGLDYPGNWRASTFIGGSPGVADPPPPAPTIVLNEVTAHTDYYNPAKPEYDSNDWIELFNATNTNVSLAGWFLSDDPANLQKWAIPTVSVLANDRISFDEVTGFHSPITAGFGLDKAGEQVLLSYLPGTPANRVVDSIQFKGQENGVSLGRYPEGGNDWFALLRTRDAANTAPPQDLVISEVMFHPPDVGTNDNTLDEFIELFNPTGVTLNLFNTNGAWRMDGGISFTFPPGRSLASGNLALVVNFDPADTAPLNAFRTKYGVTNPAVQIFGPYSGKLGNRSDRVALERPQAPDLPGDSFSWVIVDEVIYGNQNPWPISANGAGASLQRTSNSQSGNDPANWAAGIPTPGAANSTVLQPPNPPAALTANAGDGEVVLNWSPSALATSYNLKRSLTDGGPDDVIATLTTINYKDTNVSNGTTYYYVVSAENSAGESPDSMQVAATPLPPPPAAPTGLIATAGDGEVSLSWNTVAEATAYNVRRATVGGGPYATIAAGEASTGFSDITVANGTTYYYVVSAFNTFGESANSIEVSARPRGVIPTSPYANAVIAANPVAYWRLDEIEDPAAGATASDFWGGFHGTFGAAAQNGFNGIAGPRPADGFNGLESENSALRSTAGTAQSWVDLPPLGLTTASATFIAWIHPDSLVNFSGILFARAGQPATGFNIASSALGYHWNDASDTYSWNSGVLPPLGHWSFAALVVEPDRATVYLINDNGTQTGTNFVAHGSRAFVDAMRIGSDPNSVNRTFDGRIDEVAFFDYALSPEQIAGLYATAPVPPTITLTIRRIGADVQLIWPQGTLQQSEDANGPYSNVTGANSPYTIAPTAVQMFYRVLVQ